MRHVPTALYIDTEFFRSQDLRLNTRQFNILKDTFVQGGLRLLVPKMMERELIRHYQRRAAESADALEKVYRKHPVSRLSLGALPAKDEMEERCFNELKGQWDTFKEHFTVEPLPLVGNLEDVVDWYFQTQPPFSEKKSKEFPDAFILSALGSYHKEYQTNIAVVSGDGDFERACLVRRYIVHYPSLEKYVEAFKPELSSQDRIPEPTDPTRPIVTEDLTELRAILGRGSGATSIEINRVLELLQSRGENYEFFFRNVSEPMWLDYLRHRGFFDSPPIVSTATNGAVQMPSWLPISYLARVFNSEPEKVLNILERLPDTDNPRILADIVDVVLSSDSSDAFHRLAPKILSFVDHTEWGYEKIISILRKSDFFEDSFDGFTASLLLKVVEFCPDPQSEDKQASRKENPGDWTTWLEPRPRFDQWDYLEIMEKGVHPLAERIPYQVARLLIDATASMIRLQMHGEDIDESEGEDSSDVWCRRLDKPDHDYRKSEETLVHTLTFACEKVFEKEPESIAILDSALRNQRWKIFKRLRQYLYALHPNEQTKPWIREAILTHEDYAQWEHSYEFSRMVQCACKRFGVELLTEDERTQIFDAILSGPSKTNFQEWMGERFTEELFTQRQQRFHRMQFKPFASVLFGEYATYFHQLETEADEQISDEDYSPVSKIEGGTMSRRSPQPPEDLVNLADAELLTYINTWDNEHHDKDNWLVEINIEALAEAFQTVFKDTIIPDTDRLKFWIDNRERIERPIYVRAMISAMQEHVKAKHFNKLGEWFAFCEWVLAHPDREHEEGYGYKRSEESRENPHWHSSRRAVGDFIGVCVEKDAGVPISAREHLAKLLDLLCTQFDWRLDEDRPVLLNRSDQITEAINNTRSRALESLVNFGFWLRRKESEADISEVTTVLEKRFAPETEHPLSLPERAMLGMLYHNIFILDEAWATTHKVDFFPQGDLPAWVEAFDSFLHYHRPFKPLFEVLRGDFEFALQQKGNAKRQERPRGEPADPLGRHLFTYYLWDVYPLRGEASLLERYYQQTDGDRSYWANLFNYVGRALRDSGKHLDNALKGRAMQFLDWRLEVGEPTELERFASWLEAECLEPEWRLDAYSRILDVIDSKGMKIFGALRTLEKMFPDHTTKVVECFAKITDYALKHGTYIPRTDQAKPILKAGLKSSDESVRSNAERAHENLLRGGRFDFLDMDD